MDRNVKKAFLLGLGVSLLTKDRVEREVKRHLRKYRISENDSKRLAKRVISEGMRHKKDIEAKVTMAEREIARHAEELAALAKEFAPKAQRRKR